MFSKFFKIQILIFIGAFTGVFANDPAYQIKVKIDKFKGDV